MGESNSFSVPENVIAEHITSLFSEAQLADLKKTMKSMFELLYPMSLFGNYRYRNKRQSNAALQFLSSRH